MKWDDAEKVMAKVEMAYEDTLFDIESAPVFEDEDATMLIPGQRDYAVVINFGPALMGGEQLAELGDIAGEVGAKLTLSSSGMGGGNIQVRFD